MYESSSIWLITGGCGFLGTTLVADLRRAPNSPGIRIVDDLSVGTLAALEAVSPVAFATGAGLDKPSPGGPVQLFVGSVTDAELMKRAAVGVDVIVHLAAAAGVLQSLAEPRADFESNVLGTFNCLEAARLACVRRFVCASSGAALGQIDPPLHEEKAAHPISPYGAGKLAGEAYCSAYFGSFALETVTLRFGNVYGPRSSHKGSVVAKFIRQALAGEEARVYGDGKQTRDFVYSEDVVSAILAAAATSGVGGHTFQIASGHEVTIDELVSSLGAALAGSGVALRIGREGEKPGEVRRNFADTSKAERELGWRPLVGLEEGLRRTVRWFVSSDVGSDGA